MKNKFPFIFYLKNYITHNITYSTLKYFFAYRLLKKYFCIKLFIIIF